MANSNVKKSESPLVNAVLALDEGMSELERLGGKITSMDLKSETDIEQLQKLMNRFAECSHIVSSEVVGLSKHLNDARVRAETATQNVANRAQELRERRGDQQKHLDDFMQLGEKVRALNEGITELSRPAGVELTIEARNQISAKLFEIQAQLDPLIEEARQIQSHARASKMKSLESNADSLGQTLQSVRLKLASLNIESPLKH